MRKIKEVLRLKYDCGLSHRQIAVSCQMAQSTVTSYIQRAQEAGIPWPIPEDLTEEALDTKLFPAKHRVTAEAILDSPSWLLLEIDFQSSKAIFAKIDEEGYRTASFLDHRSHAWHEVITIDADDVAEVFCEHCVADLP